LKKVNKKNEVPTRSLPSIRKEWRPKQTIPAFN
jgi:hypothetical protein